MFTNFFFFINSEAGFALVAIEEEKKLNDDALLVEMDREMVNY
jgi:hypothetical protein